MSKIVILGDIHIGVRNDNLAVMEHHIKFFENVLIPYLVNNDIKTIIQLGDIFDRRKFTNHNILYQWKRRVFNILESLSIQIYTIPGNHDITFKDTLKVSALDLFLEQEYNNIHIIKTPRDLLIEGVSFLFIPWICEENEKQCLQAIEYSTSKYVIAHLELQGFEVAKGIVANHGMNKDVFKEFDGVFSGHYHHMSAVDNIIYCGTPYEITWADYGDPRGFFVMSDGKFKFVENKNKFFHKISYDELDKSMHIDQFLSWYDMSKYNGTYVKLYVKNKKNAHFFDKFVDALEKSGCISLQIVDENISFSNLEENNITITEAEDTSSIINKCIDQTEVSVDKNLLKKFFGELYQEAILKE